MLYLTKNLIKNSKRHYFTYVNNRVSKIKISNKNILDDNQLNSKALLTAQMLINNNIKSFNIPIKTSIESKNLNKINICSNDLEFICNEGIRINDNIRKLNNLNNQLEFHAFVDIIDQKKKIFNCKVKNKN